MSNYGVKPTGFVRKPISVTLAEIEASLITEFGPGLIQTSQSPMGQINGLMSDIITELWELAEDVYQSYDPDQAEGNRLDILGRLRLIQRAAGESDSVYRRSVTNESVARVTLADLERALQNVPGVTYRAVFVNESHTTDENQMPPNTIAAAVLGGDDMEVARVINQYIPTGISTHGNMSVQILEDGRCRSLWIIRPSETPTTLDVSVRVNSAYRDCPAPSTTAIAASLLEYLTTSQTRPKNGQRITQWLVRQHIEQAFPGIEVINLWGTKEGIDTPYQNDIPFTFFEMASVESVSVEFR